MEVYQRMKKKVSILNICFSTLPNQSFIWKKTRQNRFQVLSSFTSVRTIQASTRTLHIWATVCINISINAALRQMELNRNVTLAAVITELLLVCNCSCLPHTSSPIRRPKDWLLPEASGDDAVFLPRQLKTPRSRRDAQYLCFMCVVNANSGWKRDGAWEGLEAWKLLGTGY